MKLRDDAGGACIEYGVADPSRYVLDEVRPLVSSRLRPSASTVVVSIAGRPYAAFHSRKEARDAISLWRGDIDGWGRKVRQHYGAHWPAIQGKTVSIEGGLHEVGERGLEARVA